MGYFFFYYLHPLHPLLPHATLRSLRNGDGELKMKKMNLSLAYKFCDTLKSFRLFLTVKTILILNMEHSIKLEIEIFLY